MTSALWDLSVEALEDAPCLRVVCIVTRLEAGGAQRALLRLAAGLRERGYDADTWFLYQKRHAFGDADRVRVLLPRPPRSPLDHGLILLRLLRGLRAARPDAVITFTHYANILGQLAARAVGVPRRVASQRSVSSSYPASARHLDRWLGSCGLYTSNVVVSAAAAASFGAYPSRYLRRVALVPNGVDACPSPLSRSEARRAFGFDPKRPLLVAVGRLAPEKNHAVLLRALARAPEAQLAIAGEGELAGSLARLAQECGVADRTVFLGEIGEDAVSALLGAADVFALPSFFEGFSNALLEAMAAGLPIIASNAPSQAEVLCANDRAAGLLLDPDDTAGWARAIRALTGDAIRRQELGRRARAAAAEFTVARMVAGYEAALGSGADGGA